MPLVLIVIGVLFLVAAVRDQLSTLFGLVKGDFTGSGNFIYFVAAIFVIGAIGYSDKLKPLSDAFLFLVIIVLFISNKGVFANFNAALKTTDTATPTTIGMTASTMLPALPPIVTPFGPATLQGIQ